MGLHPPLDLRPATHARLRRFHPLLQSPPSPRLARMVNPSRNPEHPQGQPPRRSQLTGDQGQLPAGFEASQPQALWTRDYLWPSSLPSDPNLDFALWSRNWRQSSAGVPTRAVSRGRGKGEQGRRSRQSTPLGRHSESDPGVSEVLRTELPRDGSPRPDRRWRSPN